MANFFNYGAILGKAMQQVVRSVLAHVAEHGRLPGLHHYYISFSTKANGVVLPDHLLSRYPEQITIVLQHEFYDLKVLRDCMKVSLVFDGCKETIEVPFAAMTEFSDPSANFSMQFEGQECFVGNSTESEGEDEDEDDNSLTRDVIADISSIGDMLLAARKQSEKEAGSRMGDLIFIDDYLGKS